MRIHSLLVFACIIVIGCSTAKAQTIAGDTQASPPSRDGNMAIVDYRPLSARVLGGGDAEPGAYPSIVALAKRGFGPLDQRLFCGGTVVHERWVLTAAHCLYDIFKQPFQPDYIRVVAGIHDLALDAPATEEESRVVQVVIHPDYDPSLNLPPNDIALLKLQNPVSVPVAALFAGDSNDYIASFGVIAGWGAVDYADEANPEYPMILQDASVPLVSDDACNGPESYAGLISRSHLCAGYIDGQIDACAGDSGGPLFISVEGVQVQAAITSFGIGCGLPLFFGIYTDLSYFIPWLSDYIPVPSQSPELLAARSIEGDLIYSGASAGDADMSRGGALGWLSLLAIMLIRVWRIAWSGLHAMASHKPKASEPFQR